MPRARCAWQGCDIAAWREGLCWGHWHEWVAKGHPDLTQTTTRHVRMTSRSSWMRNTPEMQAHLIHRACEYAVQWASEHPERPAEQAWERAKEAYAVPMDMAWPSDYAPLTALAEWARQAAK